MQTRQIGRYEVIRDLKAGGMAAAILARAPDRRLVVLKRPLENDRQLFARLRDEARVGARVSHPNLVETLDIFEHEGRPVLVVGYVRGISIHDLRKGSPVPTASVARIGWQIASCLHALHEATDEHGKPFNVIHRDVSGGNILVDVGGDAHLIDLGIAKFDEGRSAHTVTGQIIGTVRYMAPEILDGKGANPASDLWALACVLVEAATGEPVFAGGTREVLARISTFKSAEDLALERIDEKLRVILTAVLRLDPTQRMTAPEIERRLRALEQECGGGQQDLADLVTKRTAEDAAHARAAAASVGVTEPVARLAEEPGFTRVERPTSQARTRTAPAPHGRGRSVALVAAGVAVTLLVVLGFTSLRRARRARIVERQASAAVVDAGVRAPSPVQDAGAAAGPIAVLPPKLPAVRALDGCGAPPKLEPFFDNDDGTFQSEAGFGSSSIIEVKFACAVPFVRVTVFDAHGDGHKVEAYDAGGKIVRAERLPSARAGAPVPPRELIVTGPDNIRSVFLVPARGDHVWYSLTTSPPDGPPPDRLPSGLPGDPPAGDRAQADRPPVPDDTGSRLPPVLREDLDRVLKVLSSCSESCAVTYRTAITRGAKPPLRNLRECADRCEGK